MSVVRPDESQVNRPVYEPWLIWGFFQFLANRTIDLDDFYPIPVFDLSPWWAQLYIKYQINKFIFSRIFMSNVIGVNNGDVYGGWKIIKEMWILMGILYKKIKFH